MAEATPVQHALSGVFISYRRSGGWEMARLIHDRLEEKGYEVFLDVEELRSGPFNTSLFGRIESLTDFVVILSKDCLGRCRSEGDWLRLEIAHAVRMKKNIVPVLLRDFEWPQAPLPDDMNALPFFQGVSASHEFFDASMDKLAALLIAKPQRGPRKALWSRILIAAAVVAAVGMAVALYMRH